MRGQSGSQQGWNGQQPATTGNGIDESRSEGYGAQNYQGGRVERELKREGHAGLGGLSDSGG
jgi:hypothetical protein